jgi:repressor LexA
MHKELTKRQTSILEFLEAYLRERGYPPSLREISKRFAIKSPKNARKHLEALERKGFIKRWANMSRAIDVLTRFFRQAAGAFLLKIEGDSMKGAGMEEGDYALVRPQKEASSGDIIVAMLDSEATVKRFARNARSIVLKPENPAMEPIRVSGGRDFTIVGKVIAVIKRLEG